MIWGCRDQGRHDRGHYYQLELLTLGTLRLMDITNRGFIIPEHNSQYKVNYSGHCGSEHNIHEKMGKQFSRVIYIHRVTIHQGHSMLASYWDGQLLQEIPSLPNSRDTRT